MSNQIDLQQLINKVLAPYIIELGLDTILPEGEAWVILGYLGEQGMDYIDIKGSPELPDSFYMNVFNQLVEIEGRLKELSFKELRIMEQQTSSCDYQWGIMSVKVRIRKLEISEYIALCSY